MEKIGILHLSDIHFCAENEDEVKHLLDKLKSDVACVCKTEETRIRAICLTGDLINKGSEHASAFSSFETTFLQPLLSALNLDFGSVFIVPGNHEVDITKIERFSEEGLTHSLTNCASIEEVLRGSDSVALERLMYLREINDKFCKSKLLYKDSFCQCYEKDIDGILFGFACLNSAWRSSGKGDTERGKMILGAYQVENALQKSENTQVKICLMHHPLDWLLACDKYEVERLIYKFDFILNGHIHTLDAKGIIAYQGQSVVNTCGRFYPSKDFYNGYSIIAIDSNTYQGQIFFRQYYSSPRNCFDKSLTLYNDGQFVFSLGKKDPLAVKAFEIVHDLIPGFCDYANSFLLSNVITPTNHKTFEEAFVTPPLGKWSEYNKETTPEPKDYASYNPSTEYYSLERLVSDTEKNLLIYGKKEYGKTTLIHYFTNFYLKNYNLYGLLPIIINCKDSFPGKKSVEKKCEAFLLEFGTGKLSISLDEIAELAKQGKFAFFFDNFESAPSKALSHIKSFIDVYPNNRFLFFALETVDKGPVEHAADVLGQKLDRVYIHSLGKHQIRNLASNILSEELPISDNIIDKAILCIQNINLPKTPFVVSLVLSICKENEDFVPVNEANVMENFLETLLEKNAADSAKTSSYDYTIKVDFLCYLIGEMHRNNRYYFSRQEFEQLLQAYHAEKGWTVQDTQFDSLFFSKGILYQFGDTVAFRYTCMANYYLAKLALKSSELLNAILEGDNYLLYSNELNYITGLDRNREDVYNKISTEMDGLITEYRPCLEILDHYGIQTNFSIESEKLGEALSRRLSVEESDQISDTRGAPEIADSRKMQKSTEQLPSIDSKLKFFSTLLIYATVLKNSELYNVPAKEKMIRSMAEGMCIALSILIKSFNDSKPQLLQHIQNISDPAPDSERKLSTEDIARFTEDTVKIVLPIAVENIAFEQMGSAKLKSVILPLIQGDNAKGSFSQFLMLFLYCDLRISGCLKELSSFVKRTSSKDLLTIALFKTLYYYKAHYFPRQHDSDLENIIANINLKLNNMDHRMNGLIKSQVLKKIRGSRKKE